MIDVDEKIDYKDKKFHKLSSNDLINYILKRYHLNLKSDLRDLSEETFKIYDVYFKDDGNFLESVHILVNNLRTNLEAHMIKEERRLFLHIKEYEKDTSSQKIEKIIEEIESVEKNNNEIEYSIKELKRVTKDYTKARDLHSGYESLYRKLEALEIETRDHIALERNILYRRLRNGKEKK